MECKGSRNRNVRKGGEHDLIETSWNVKFVDDVDEELVAVGFNRNIVECKV